MIKVRVVRLTDSTVKFFSKDNVPLGHEEVRELPDFELVFDAGLSKAQRRHALKMVTRKIKGVTVFPRGRHDRDASRKNFSFDVDVNTDYVKIRLKGAGVVIDRVIVTNQGRVRGKVEKAKEQMLMGVI